jgi:hypothetical protein
VNGKFKGCLFLFLGFFIFLIGLSAIDRVPGSDLLALYITDAVAFGGLLMIMFGALLVIFSPRNEN